MSDAGHIPVLSTEVVEALSLPRNGYLVDATFGRGGHSRLCLEWMGPEGRILAIDRDPEAVGYAGFHFCHEPRLKVVHGTFSEIAQLIQKHASGVRIDAILLDLGVSSPQLDTAERGFSFNATGPLDMRMDPDRGQTAEEWLCEVDEAELAQVIRTLGEERFARRIASAIKRAVLENKLGTTGDLAAIVAAAVPTRERNKHPATRTFQAIRMHINAELEELKKVLPQALEALVTGGRLVVISFHSLEDRIVKRFMRDCARGDHYPPDLPITADHLNPGARLIGKAVRAGEAELRCNPRARSAVMRVAEKL